ncbi:MAG: DUF4336 domain-containing protein, partial [Okeania sp. SIO2H7]|nr:DUF4336 domain-containing protein [Okeania sp. SIO2H7]
MLKNIDNNIWVSEQPLKYWGLEVGTRMTIVRLKTGELMVISPIQVNNITIDELREIGKVHFIIAPNLYHHLFVTDFQALYPQAKLLVATGLELKRADLKIDLILDEDTPQFWDEVEYLYFEGFKVLDIGGPSPLQEIVFFHRESKTLILTDTAFYFDASFPWITQLATRVIGGYNKLGPSLLEKLATKDKNKIEKSIRQILRWDFKRIVMAHGSIVENEAKKK